MDSLREQIKELERRPPRKTDCPHSPYAKDGKHYDSFVRNPICGDCFADQILNLFKPKVEGVKVIGNKAKLGCSLISRYPHKEVSDVIDEACEHQLQDCKDKLLGVME